jgi:protease I
MAPRDALPPHLAVLVEEGTNPIEFHYCRLRLLEAGARVTVVGSRRLEYRLEDHSTARVDATAQQVMGEPFDGVVIPGGLGPEKLRQDPAVVALVQDCFKRGKLCAAICHGQQVLISAGLMRGVRATAAWSMLDDLRAVGAVVAENARAVRDGQIVTGVFPHDLPAFCQLALAALSELAGWQLPAGYPQRLADQTWGIVVDDASDSVQVNYLKLRILEEGGRPLFLGRRVGQEMRLGSPAWPWGEMGPSATADRALPDPGAVGSCDADAEANARAIAAPELDGLLLPGGLGAWMIRGHPGLKMLVGWLVVAGIPVAAVGRGAKILLSADVLAGRSVTCAPEMRDDLIHALPEIRYRDAPVVGDGTLLTCQGTEDLPALMRALLAGSLPPRLSGRSRPPGSSEPARGG